MLVKQIAVNNTLRNYMYLIACPETREAVAIDPLDHQVCLSVAKELGWDIRGVINTHEHHDHIGGNEPVIKATRRCWNVGAANCFRYAWAYFLPYLSAL